MPVFFVYHKTKQKSERTGKARARPLIPFPLPRLEKDNREPERLAYLEEKIKIKKLIFW